MINGTNLHNSSLKISEFVFIKKKFIQRKDYPNVLSFLHYHNGKNMKLFICISNLALIFLDQSTRYQVRVYMSPRI